jgi:hypothetical protein
MSIQDDELYEAASLLDLERMENALKLGADINGLDEGGEGPLTHAIAEWARHWDEPDSAREGGPAATRDRCRNAVLWLVEHGADVNAIGPGGHAPLSAAVLRYDPWLVRFLLECGADPTYEEFPEDPDEAPTALRYAQTDFLLVVHGTDEYVDLWEINVLLDITILQRRCRLGKSIEQALTPAESALPCVGWCEAAYLAMLMVNRNDVELLRPFISDNVTFQCDQDGVAITGRQDVLSYLRANPSMLRDGMGLSCVADVGVNTEGPCVVLMRGADETQVAIVTIHPHEGVICKIAVDRRVTEQNRARLIPLPLI